MNLGEHCIGRLQIAETNRQFSIAPIQKRGSPPRWGECPTSRPRDFRRAQPSLVGRVPPRGASPGSPGEGTRPTSEPRASPQPAQTRNVPGDSVRHREPPDDPEGPGSKQRVGKSEAEQPTHPRQAHPTHQWRVTDPKGIERPRQPEIPAQHRVGRPEHAASGTLQSRRRVHPAPGIERLSGRFIPPQHHPNRHQQADHHPAPPPNRRSRADHGWGTGCLGHNVASVTQTVCGPRAC